MIYVVINKYAKWFSIWLYQSFRNQENFILPNPWRKWGKTLRKRWLQNIKREGVLPASKIFYFCAKYLEENNVMSTNPFVLLATPFTYCPVRIIKPLYVKKIFLLQANFLQISIKLTRANSNWQCLKISMKQ